MSGSLLKEDTFVIQSADVPKVRGKRPEIIADFGVTLALQIDPNADSNASQWVAIRGESDEDVKSAKAFTIAFCNPDVKEQMYFPGFPFFIFDAFKEQVKRKIQKQFGVVLLMKGDGFIHAHGEELGVASAFSKILYMYSHSKDTSDKEKQAALQFDQHVRLSHDQHAQGLYELPNLLKKDILEIIDIPVEATAEEPVIKDDISTRLRKASPPSVVTTAAVDDVIQVDSSSQEDIDLINLCSSDDSQNSDRSIYESDDDDDDEEEESDDDDKSDRKLDYDGAAHEPIDISLPPNFVIKAWMQANYEGTSNPNDFVNKSDMLTHFCNHFGVPNHPELSNMFFDRLAVRIFPSDNNYRSVKTKRTKSKHSKRRLVCLRRRTLDEGGNSRGSAKAQLSMSHPIPSLSPSTSAAVNQSSTTMKEWNTSRMVSAGSPVPVQPVIRPSVPTVQPAPRFQNTQPHPPVFQSNSGSPYQITQHHIRRQSPPADIRPGIGEWLVTGNTPVPRRPVPARRSHNPSGAESITKRVANMNNRDLIRRPRPRPDHSLRPIVIDGSNVAVSHGNKERFSCRGIALCARYFIERGHSDVTCLVPNYRKGGGGTPPSFDVSLLIELEEIGIVKLTPSRRVAGQNIVCYDDRFIVELAAANGGVIVSNDQYRDLMATTPQWRPVIERQLLQYTVVGDLFMFPQDPLGRNGPTLDVFLKAPSNGQARPSPAVDIPGFYPPQQRSPLRQSTPPRNAWNNRSSGPGSPAMMLTPHQNVMLNKMAELLPNNKKEIELFIKRNSKITGLEEMLDRFLQIQSL